jgi:hypothetical protein
MAAELAERERRTTTEVFRQVEATLDRQIAALAGAFDAADLQYGAGFHGHRQPERQG